MVKTLRSAFMIAPLLWGAGLGAQTEDMTGVTPTASTPAAASNSQEFCITVMGGFPSDSEIARYQFFRLTQDISADATPQFQAALNHYGDPKVDETTPVLEVIETIANPVLRQAAPEIVVANMAHLIDFQTRCETYVSGQIQSLLAYDASLGDSNAVIAEDALFLRQILSESLLRLGADKDETHWYAAAQYEGALVSTRDVIEFAQYSDEIDDIEALYMVDLDGRLARSNDMINEEMDRNALADAVTLSEDMNKAEKDRHRERTIMTLFRILNAY